MEDVTIRIPTSGDEQRDHDEIEAAAESYLRAAWEPTDSEPGNWLVLTDPTSGRTCLIEVVSPLWQES